MSGSPGDNADLWQWQGPDGAAPAPRPRDPAMQDLYDLHDYFHAGAPAPEFDAQGVRVGPRGSRVHRRAKTAAAPPPPPPPQPTRTPPTSPAPPVSPAPAAQPVPPVAAQLGAWGVLGRCWLAAAVWLALSAGVVAIASRGSVGGGVGSVALALLAVGAIGLVWPDDWGVTPWRLAAAVPPLATFGASLVLGMGVIGAFSDLRVAAFAGLGGGGVVLALGAFVVPRQGWRQCYDALARAAGHTP